jgi:AraC-like DNA-binding protein
MTSGNVAPGDSISPFVKSILIFEDQTPTPSHALHFYADGLPGIVFQQSEHMEVSPQNKKMPELFLYGQTIHPIELKIKGPYKFIVFQLYPFVIESFFSIDPKSLNDECYDLATMQHANVGELIATLNQPSDFGDWTKHITAFLLEIFQVKKDKLDYRIQQAIVSIMETDGQVQIQEIRKQFDMSERTFERHFQAQVGITPKQFARIIQFQKSLNHLQNQEYNNLTDIVYQNGFADQSHFIRVFKSFTSTTPSKFKSN